MEASFSWDRFHSDCRHVSSASIICEDGVIFTHKLILANVSRLMEDILRDIPAADDVTLYLKSFSKLKVETFLFDVLQNKEPDLCLSSIFDIKNHTSTTTSKASTKACAIKKDMAVAIGFRKKVDEQQIAKVEVKEEISFDEDTFDPIKFDDSFDQVEPDVVLGEKNESVKFNSFQELDEKFDSETEENIKNFEKDLIDNPKTKSEIISNQKTVKKINYAKAVALFKSGRVQSYRAAAIRYGVTSHHVKKYVLSGGSFSGRGNSLRRFTKEEEKMIVERVLELASSEGKDLNYRLLIDIVLEEAEIVKTNQPERSDQMEFGDDRSVKSPIYTFVVNFAKRNNITNLLNTHIKKDREERRVHECEICYRTFTYQNTLEHHKRKIHSFLFNNH